MSLFEKRVEEHLQHLHVGIKARKEMLTHDPTEKERIELERQIRDWEAEYTQFYEDLEQHNKLVTKPWPGDQDVRRVEIICLKYKDDIVEQRCLAKLNEHTYWPYKLNWFNNRDPEKYTTANFAKAWNVLTQQSTCDYICIMDSDAFVTDHWLTKMMQSFESDFKCRTEPGGRGDLTYPGKVGLVVPVTHPGGAHTIQGKYRKHPESRAPFVCDAQVSGFFFLFKKEMFNEIGGFDERFYLHGQDSEWIDRVLESRWQIIVRPDVHIDHFVSASISAAKERKEFSYDMDIFWTQTQYAVIRDEKGRGVYEPC